jgi:hypothetical protein
MCLVLVLGDTVLSEPDLLAEVELSGLVDTDETGVMGSVEGVVSPRDFVSVEVAAVVFATGLDPNILGDDDPNNEVFVVPRFPKRDAGGAELMTGLALSFLSPVEEPKREETVLGMDDGKELAATSLSIFNPEAVEDVVATDEGAGLDCIGVTTVDAEGLELNPNELKEEVPPILNPPVPNWKGRLLPEEGGTVFNGFDEVKLPCDCGWCCWDCCLLLVV